MFFVFDIGGTNTKVSTSLDGNTLTEVKIFPTPKFFNDGIQAIHSQAQALSNGEKIETVAGGVAGPLDKEKSMLVNSPNIPGWNLKPLKESLIEVFKCPIYLENDSSLVGLGEAVFGAGQGYPIVAYLTISTGVGGVRIVDGKIDRSSLGFEPGHQVITQENTPCSCGGVGHLEALISGQSLQKKYNQDPQTITDEGIWDEVARNLAIGLNNTIVYWSPDIVVLGGSVAKSIPLDKVVRNLSQVMTIFPSPPQVVKASLQDSGGLYGALAYLNSQAH